jgi:hypothetical protein
MNSLTLSEKVTSIVSAFNGPDCDPETIAWAEDLTAGKKLFEWIAAQVHWDNEHRDSSGYEVSSERDILACLSPIAGGMAFSYVIKHNYVWMLPTNRTPDKAERSSKNRLSQRRCRASGGRGRNSET